MKNEYSIGKERISKMFRESRKVNASANPNTFKRYELTLVECKKRGVRFLPAQVMRPIFQSAGL